MRSGARWLAIVSVALSSWLTIPVGLASQQLQQPDFRSASSELVVLPVIVTDGQKRYVQDLPKDSFSVFDNGRRVPISLFSNEDTPVTVGLILDASGSMRPKMSEVVAASFAFAQSSNPRDELFVIQFNDEVQDAVKSKRFLLASDFDTLVSSLKSIQPTGRTALYDAVLAGLDYLGTGTRPRKVLIVLSDGGDNSSSSTLNQALARARASDAAIYTIGLYDDEDRDRNPGVLQLLARTTGGERFQPRSAGPLMEACRQIAREIRNVYTIGYVPPAQDGGFHQVRVQVTPSHAQKLKVRTRPGYFAGAKSSLREPSGD